MSDGAFVLIPAWVIREFDLSKNELVVYIALLGRADRNGLAWPSMQTLCKEARSSEPTVKKALRSLEARGLVKRTERRRQGLRNLPNLYKIAIFDREPGGGGKKFTPVGARTSDQWGKDVHPEVDTQEVDTQEEDMRRTLPSARATTKDFSFSSSSASEKQLTYLRDLYIHYYGEIPSEEVTDRFRGLTSEEATEAIKAFLRAMPRASEYEGPEFGTPEYEALSQKGRVYADQGMVPDGQRPLLLLGVDDYADEEWRVNVETGEVS